MEALFFNVSSLCSVELCSLTVLKVSNGFLEGIVRGYKAGILTENNYKNLTQCETLEGTSLRHNFAFLFMVFTL